MASFTHAQFGEVIVKRNRRSRRLSFRFNNKDQLVVSSPYLVPLYFIKRSIDDSARDIHDLRAHQPAKHIYREGDLIGHKRTLRFIKGSPRRYKIDDKELIIYLSNVDRTGQKSVQEYTREIITRVYRKDARIYLDARLAILAARHGYSYQKTRLTHASTRWGSCTTKGTINLNIALMKLPLELIDYVLIHELCHTREMNHSRAFWRLVQTALPDYQLLRTTLKKYDTTI